MAAGKVNLREAKDDNGLNALHFAAARGHLEVCKFLVEGSGLDVNSTATEGASRTFGFIWSSNPQVPTS
jgi:ankyrin repeat protein